MSMLLSLLFLFLLLSCSSADVVCAHITNLTSLGACGVNVYTCFMVITIQIDAIRPELHRLDVETGEHKSWMMPALIGSIAPREKGGLVAAVGKGRYAITFNEKWEVNLSMETDILGQSSLR